MVGELAAAVSHELRQPLAAIRANAEAGATLLRRDPVDLGELALIFRDIGADDMRAACILDDIRLLLRKESPVMAPVDVNEMCRHAIQLLQRDAMLRRVQLELLLEPRLERTLGDPVELQQIIINLVLNALDAGAMSPGIRTVMVNTVRHHGEIEIAVRDSGPGISAEAMKHLFEPFFSTKTQGLGMGLAIVHSIVERHHGRIVAENIPSGGALFRVLLNAVS
jgi:C4-dicarboxylate-specific signal transduction histidine kinase